MTKVTKTCRPLPIKSASCRLQGEVHERAGRARSAEVHGADLHCLALGRPSLGEGGPGPPTRPPW
eukprot:7019934-Alexandrium_andersonii.AAC.1